MTHISALWRQTASSKCLAENPVGVPAGYLRHGVVFEMQLNAPQVEQALVHMLA